MKIKIFRFRSLITFYTSAAIVFSFLLFPGCGTVNIESFRKDSIHNREQKKLNAGYEAFMKADYEKAADIFNSLYQTGNSGRAKRYALYGLACARLLTAKTTMDFDKAITLWNTWADSVPDNIAQEDPRLLDPFIQRTDPPCKKEKEIEALRMTIERMKKENETLRHQILTLEAIDQTIEKKKNDILMPKQ